MKLKKCSHIWPVSEKAGNPPDGWSGWPEKKQFAFVLTHDVDTAKGQDKSYRLMEYEESLGFRSSFYFVPERYKVSESLRNEITNRGFEVGVHGLVHDGKLYNSKMIFQKRAIKINQYLKSWGAVGFRSPSMHHKLDWIHDLDIEYDASTFDTDPFEPQSGGVGTIFPFCVRGNSDQKSYIEFPYTLPQDFTLFVLMKEKNINIWKKKLDWIADKGGMALLNVHPDYMNFTGKNLCLEGYPAELYLEFLEYVKSNYSGTYWHALPRIISRYISTTKETHQKLD